MNNWFDRAVDGLEAAYARGEMTQEEFRREMRALNDELRGEAEDAADRAYRDTMGDY